MSRRTPSALNASHDFGSGAEVEAFEVGLATEVGVEHVVGLGSGTAAPHLMLAAAGVQAGDEFILPANTFFATAEAVVTTGARPVLVDIDPETGNVNPGPGATGVGVPTVSVHLVPSRAGQRARRPGGRGARSRHTDH